MGHYSQASQNGIAKPAMHSSAQQQNNFEQQYMSEYFYHSTVNNDGPDHRTAQKPSQIYKHPDMVNSLRNGVQKQS